MVTGRGGEHKALTECHTGIGSALADWILQEEGLKRGLKMPETFSPNAEICKHGVVRRDWIESTPRHPAFEFSHPCDECELEAAEEEAKQRAWRASPEGQAAQLRTDLLGQLRSLHIDIRLSRRDRRDARRSWARQVSLAAFRQDRGMDAESKLELARDLRERRVDLIQPILAYRKLRKELFPSR